MEIQEKKRDFSTEGMQPKIPKKGKIKNDQKGVSSQHMFFDTLKADVSFKMKEKIKNHQKDVFFLSSHNTICFSTFQKLTSALRRIKRSEPSLPNPSIKYGFFFCSLIFFSALEKLSERGRES